LRLATTTHDRRDRRGPLQRPMTNSAGNDAMQRRLRSLSLVYSVSGESLPVLSLVRPVLSSSNSVNKRSISGGTLCGTSYRSLSPAPMIACMASYNDACEGIVREDRRPRWRRPVIVTFPTLGLLNRQPPISVPRNPYWLLFESEDISQTNSARSTGHRSLLPRGGPLGPGRRRCVGAKSSGARAAKIIAQDEVPTRQCRPRH
jgi:hypothetical protein